MPIPPPPAAVSFQGQPLLRLTIAQVNEDTGEVGRQGNEFHVIHRVPTVARKKMRYGDNSSISAWQYDDVARQLQQELREHSRDHVDPVLHAVAETKEGFPYPLRNVAIVLCSDIDETGPLPPCWSSRFEAYRGSGCYCACEDIHHLTEFTPDELKKMKGYDNKPLSVDGSLEGIRRLRPYGPNDNGLGVGRDTRLAYIGTARRRDYSDGSFGPWYDYPCIPAQCPDYWSDGTTPQGNPKPPVCRWHGILRFVPLRYVENDPVLWTFATSGFQSHNNITVALQRLKEQVGTVVMVPLVLRVSIERGGTGARYAKMSHTQSAVVSLMPLYPLSVSRDIARKQLEEREQIQTLRERVLPSSRLLMAHDESDEAARERALEFSGKVFIPPNSAVDTADDISSASDIVEAEFDDAEDVVEPAHDNGNELTAVDLIKKFAELIDIDPTPVITAAEHKVTDSDNVTMDECAQKFVDFAQACDIIGLRGDDALAVSRHSRGFSKATKRLSSAITLCNANKLDMQILLEQIKDNDYNIDAAITFVTQLTDAQS